MTLRPYQEQLKEAIHASWAAGNLNVAAVLPTGAGKTVLFSDIVKEHRGPACVIAHRKELVCQMSLALARQEVHHRVIGPDNLVGLINRIHTEELGRSYYHPSASVAVASVDTMMSRQSKLEGWCRSVTLWVTDEAHHLLARTNNGGGPGSDPKPNKWGRAVQMFPNAKGLGVTATPHRADGLGLGAHADGVFHAMVEGPRLRQLIAAGYLSDYRIFAPACSIDTAGIPLGKDGDYSKPKLKMASRKSQVVGDVLDHYRRFCGGLLTVVFATDVETATDMARRFNADGIKAAVLSGETPDAERFQTLKRFARREVMVLFNVALFTEGFDLPAIEAMIDAAPTMSFAVAVQRWGRVLRTFPGKPYGLIVDAVGNVAKHARVVEENGNLVIDLCARSWTLDRTDRRTRQTPDDAIPIKTCVSCLADYAAVYPCCPYCGCKPVPAARSGPEFVDGDILELDPAVLAEMQGGIANMTVDQYMATSGALYLRDSIARASAAKRFGEKQGALAALQESIGWWAAWQNQRGRSDSEGYRRFYYRFRHDVLTAQTLGTKEMNELKIAIDNVINTEYNVN